MHPAWAIKSEENAWIETSYRAHALHGIPGDAEEHQLPRDKRLFFKAAMPGNIGGLPSLYNIMNLGA